MRPAEHGDHAPLAVDVAQGVGELRRLAVGGHEQDVRVGGHLAGEVLAAGVADEADVVPRFLAPHPDHLGHDAREVGVHDLAPEGIVRAPRDQVEDADAEMSHGTS